VEIPDYRRLDGVEVTNQDGEKLGKVDGLFVDDQVNVPTWVAVGSGFFGSHHSLVPLAQTRFVDGRLLVPYSKDDLTLAPHHDPDKPLTVEQEQTLFAHYNVGYSDADGPGPHTGVEAHQTGLTGSPDAGSHPVDLAEVQVLAPEVPGVPGLPTATVSPRLRRYRPPEQPY
jgi:hypothetical protein